MTHEKGTEDLRIPFHVLPCANGTKAERVEKRKLPAVSWEFIRVLDAVFRGRQVGSEVFSDPLHWGT